MIGKNKVMPVKIYGQTMYVNLAFAITLKAASGYLSEKLMTEIFMRNIRKGMTVVDIGAHMGYYTLLAAEITGIDGYVFSFEPEPFNFALLRKNIDINNHHNVTAVQKAVIDKSLSATFYIKDFAEHSVIKCGTSQKSIVVDAVSLDDFFTNNIVDIIKIDVEGAEILVLKGAHRILSANPCLKLFIEFSPVIIRRAGYEPSEFLAILHSYGFKIYVIDEENYTTRLVGNSSKICKDSGYVNLFCEK
jgi:FkbM family methyltransferase